MSRRRLSTVRCVLSAVCCALATGCASTVKEIRHHPEQERLERLLAAITPHTHEPQTHYWVRVAESKKGPVGLAILPQRHIYLGRELVAKADDAVLTALIAHGVAHDQLHHQGQRDVLGTASRAAFKVGGIVVPGLSHGHHLGTPFVESAMGAGQERAADRRTVEYLQAVGRSAEDLRRALELLAAEGYAERVGRLTARKRDFLHRIERLR